jgi:hypothetical protein
MSQRAVILVCAYDKVNVSISCVDIWNAISMKISVCFLAANTVLLQLGYFGQTAAVWQSCQ